MCFRHVFVSCAIVLALSLAPAGAHGEPGQLAASKKVRRIVKADIKRNVVPALMSVMTPKELEIARSVRVRVVIDQNFQRVVAIQRREGGSRTIEISTGFLSLIGSVADANTVAVRFGKTDELAPYLQSISEYIRNSTAVLESGRSLAPPVPFWEFANVELSDYQEFSKSARYDSEFTGRVRVGLLYVLAHEYGHHVLGHHSPEKRPTNNIESRRNEDEADDFSIRLNWFLGNNALLAVDYWMVMALVEDGLPKGTHSPSACRLEKFLDAGISFSGGIPELDGYLASIEAGRKQLLEICEAGGALPDTTIPGLF